MRKACFILFISFHASALDLNTGFSDEERLEPFQMIYDEWGYLPEQLIEIKENSFFGVSRNSLGVASYDLDATLVQGWPVTPFSDPTLPTAITEHYVSNNANNDIGEFYGIGCLSFNPLRYGDLEEDGADELFIFAMDRFGTQALSIFSPALEKQVFSIQWALDDGFANDTLTEEARLKAEQSSVYLVADKPEDPQYFSALVMEFPYSRMGYDTALSHYAKLYNRDFDSDGKADLVAWRKVYQSRQLQDPLKGYALISNTLHHYAASEEGYILQDTDQATVQQWLTDAGLTWQKGFPSYSECEGQEGELIPEMHDPLLNDPDVLQ